MEDEAESWRDVATEPRDTRSSETGRGGKDTPPLPKLRKAQPCPHLDFVVNLI